MMLVKRMMCVCICVLISNVSQADIVGDTSEFSGVQGQDNWEYGFWFGTGAGYGADDFVLLDDNKFNGSYWDYAPNPNFLTIAENTWHTNGGSGTGAFMAPIKRWESEGTGMMKVTGLWRNNDTARSVSALSRNGTTARIFVEGVMVYQQKISWWAYPGYTGYEVSFPVSLGDRVDFLIDSDGDVNDDLTYFTTTLDLTSTVPEPSSIAMLGLMGMGLIRRRVR